jgi:hypothetical protein
MAEIARYLSRGLLLSFIISIYVGPQFTGFTNPAPFSFPLVKRQLMLHIGTLIMKRQTAFPALLWIHFYLSFNLLKIL